MLHAPLRSRIRHWQFKLQRCSSLELEQPTLSGAVTYHTAYVFERMPCSLDEAARSCVLLSAAQLCIGCGVPDSVYGLWLACTIPLLRRIKAYDHMYAGLTCVAPPSCSYSPGFRYSPNVALRVYWFYVSAGHSSCSVSFCFFLCMQWLCVVPVRTFQGAYLLRVRLQSVVKGGVGANCTVQCVTPKVLGSECDCVHVCAFVL
jgi:hypothetical protein